MGLFGYYNTHYDPPLTGQERANTAYDWYTTSYEGGIVLPDIDEAIRSVVEAYTNGGVDPTNGATYFAHADSYDQAISRVDGLKAQAAQDGNTSSLTVGYLPGSDYLVYSNLYPPPYGQYPR